MTSHALRALLARHLTALNEHDIPALMAFYTDDAVVTSPMFNTVAGSAAIREAFEALFKLWPDYAVQLKDSLIVCEQNRAVEFTRVTATHKAELFGLAPTGDQITYDSVRLFSFRGEHIVEERRLYDLVGVLDGLRKAQLERELAVAGEIQRILLPRTTQSGPYFDAVGMSVPSLAIGGDFFEYVELPSGNFGVALGDVSGKGSAAALLASHVQGIFSVEAEAERGPGETLQRVNRALRRRGIEPHFVTLTYGVLTPDGSFRYSNAGHNPPLLLTASGVQRLSAGGLVLGILDDLEFPEGTTTLQPGDAVVAFSDGVTEARNPEGEDLTDQRLLAFMAGRHGHTPRALLDEVTAQIRSFVGDAPQRDDMTMLILQYRT